MKKTPLNEVHEALGANFGECAGWLTPCNYGDEIDEYRSVRKDVGIIDLSNRGKLRISGKDHLKFLQGMLTNDVVKLKSGSGRYATLLTVKGRIISDMRLYKNHDSIYMDLEPTLNIRVAELLTKFRLSYKVDIEDLTNDLVLISIHGPKANNLLSSTFETGASGIREFDHFTKKVNGVELTITKSNRTGEEGYDICLPNQGAVSLWNMLINKGEEFCIKPFGFDAFEMLRIEAGIPRCGVDMDESNIPIEAGLWNALDFEKGCYVGQEVIARIKWRGHINWRLVGLVVEGDKLPERGNEMFIGKKRVGRITSSAFSPFLNKPIALGYVRREFKEPGKILWLKTASGELNEASVSKIPFLHCSRYQRTNQ